MFPELSHSSLTYLRDFLCRRCLAISLSDSRSATRQCPVPASWFAKSLHASILEARQTDLPAKNMRFGLCGWAKFMRHHPAHTVPADPRPAAGYGVCRLPSGPNLSLSHWPLRAPATPPISHNGKLVGRLRLVPRLRLGCRGRLAGLALTSTFNCSI